jgi:hypothetical protein
MRWTDLPPDRDAADGRVSGLTRGQWQELRERLERLPPGHPSRPGDAGLPDEARSAGEDAADQGLPDEDDPAGARGVQDDDPVRGRAPGERAEPGRRRAPDAARAAAGGAHEPYRPWFTTGEPPEPWFAADPPG